MYTVSEETPTREELWREYLTNRSRGGRFLIINNNIAAATAVVVGLSRGDGRKRFVFRRRGVRSFCLIIIIITTVFRTIKFYTTSVGLYNITFLYVCQNTVIKKCNNINNNICWRTAIHWCLLIVIYISIGLWLIGQL
jgi:hypothetical protein